MPATSAADRSVLRADTRFTASWISAAFESCAAATTASTRLALSSSALIRSTNERMQLVADRELVGQWRDAGELVVIELTGQLHQRQRAAFRGFDAPLGDGSIRAVAQQRHRVVDVEPLELDGLEARRCRTSMACRSVR